MFSATLLLCIFTLQSTGASNLQVSSKLPQVPPIYRCLQSTGDLKSTTGASIQQVTSNLQVSSKLQQEPPIYKRCLQPTTDDLQTTPASASSLPQNLKQNSIRKVFYSTYLSYRNIIYHFLLFAITPFLKI